MCRVHGRVCCVEAARSGSRRRRACGRRRVAGGNAVPCAGSVAWRGPPPPGARGGSVGVWECYAGWMRGVQPSRPPADGTVIEERGAAAQKSKTQKWPFPVILVIRTQLQTPNWRLGSGDTCQILGQIYIQIPGLWGGQTYRYLALGRSNIQILTTLISHGEGHAKHS